MNSRVVIAVLAIVGTVACSKESKTEQKDAGRHVVGPTKGPTPSEALPPQVTQPRAARNPSVAGTPTWYTQFPLKQVDAKPGDKVWALHELPGGRATLEIVEVVSVDGTSATVARLGTAPNGKLARAPREEQYAHVPGAAILPAHTVTEANVRAGDLVVTYRYGVPSPTLASVAAIENGIATVEHPVAKTLRKEKVEYAEVLLQGIAPLSWVAVPDGGAWKRVAVATIEGDVLYGVDSLLHYTSAKVGDCKPLNPQLKDRRVGDKVIVFPIAGRSHEDTIRRIDLPRWLFEVSDTEPVPFDRVYDGI
jgi:hypothetical protein